MSFRFSNNLLEPSWDDRAIDRIEIDLLETIDAASRGAFYDGVGALRDVGQNHLLQMLALITMAQPVSMDADAIRAQRVAALRALAPMTAEEVRRATFRAQYDGFRDHAGVAAGLDHRDVLQGRHASGVAGVARRPGRHARRARGSARSART